MKKTFYSIVSALILGVILALIFPTWFLRGDAQWTYLNDTARVDIYFEGSPKNGRVEVGGKENDLRITRPKFLSVNRSQGVVVEIPVSYRTKSYKIKFTPQADEWGNNTKVIVRFLGQYFQYDGEKRPAWVVFRNITLNGQPVAGERVVWHDQHFIQKYPLHSSEISTLTFDVRKPLAASDISFVTIVALFFACLLLSLFFAPLKRVVDRGLTFIDRKDIAHTLKDGYLHIDPVYRRSFWIIFGVLCFAFGFHAIQFMWGDHDWLLLYRNQRWLALAFVGRYMVYSVKVPISNGVFLPLFYDIIAFITLAINAILLCKYWRLEKRITYFVLCGLILTAQPFTLCMLYYVNMLPEIFIGVTYALSALILSEKVAMGEGSLLRKVLFSLISIVLINFALAVYPVIITTIAVAFAGRLLILSFDWDGSWRQLKSYIRPCLISAAHIILGIVLYKLVITFVFPYRSFYNTDTLSLEQIPARLRILLEQCFHQLYDYRMPFLSQWILWVFLGITILLVLHICSTGGVKQKIVRLFLLFGSLFATQATMVVAKLHLVAGRVELFGLVFFEVLVMVLTITRLKKLHNLWVIAGAGIIFTSVIHDLDCLRVWKLGFDAEKMLWNRVLARLESKKEFNPTRRYDFVLIGNPIAMRPRYYTGPKRFNVVSDDLLTYSYHRGFSSFLPYEFYYPTSILRQGISSFHKARPDYVVRLKRLYQAGVLQKAEVWPKPNGVIVWKDIVLFVTDGKELENYRKKFERELGKK